jgi:hypothetical protein
MGVWPGPDTGAPARRAGIGETGREDGKLGRGRGAAMEHEAGVGG